jgi:hypothetical protein
VHAACKKSWCRDSELQLASTLGLESLHAAWKKSWLEILDKACLQELLVGNSSCNSLQEILGGKLFVQLLARNILVNNSKWSSLQGI